MSRLSLRTRLLLTLVFLIGFGMLTQGAVQYTAMKKHLVDKVDRQLEVIGRSAAGHALESSPGEPPMFIDDGDGDSDAQLARSGALASFVQVRDADGRVLEEAVVATVDDAPIVPRRLSLDGRAVAFFYAASDRYDDGEHDWRVRAQRLPGGRGYIVVAQPMRDTHATLHTLRTNSIGAGLTVVGVVSLMAWWLVRRGLRPLDHIGATAEAIGAGDLSRRVEPAGGNTEVGRLGAALNAMLSQLEGAFARRAESEDRLRRFVADASHELRTPLTSIRGYAEMFRRGVASDPDDLATAMRRIEEESARMGSLVDELLLLARLDEGRPLGSEGLDLAELARDAVADARATDPGRAVTSEGVAAAWVTGDRDRLRQVFANLLRNALTHTPAGTAVTVTLARRDGVVRVEVTDRGPGLSPRQRERVFERFYRGDASRSRAAGGSGLGLSIVEAIVTAHGGQAGVESEPGQGATFWFTIPEGEPRSGGGATAVSPD